MTAACLRLVVADLAVRVCGILWLLKASGSAPLPCFWYEPRGVENRLRSLLDACEPRLTRDRLAEAVGVHVNTVDGWLDAGVRPTERNLEGLARALEGNADAHRDLLRGLRLAYAARDLLQAVDDAVGGGASEMASRLVKWANLMLEMPRNSRNPRENDYKMVHAALLGAGGPEGTPLPWIVSMLRSLWREEPDAVWRTAIAAAARPWLDHLQFVAARLGQEAHEELKRAFGNEVPAAAIREIVWLAQADPAELARDPRFAAAQSVLMQTGGPVAVAHNKELAWKAIDRGDLLGALSHLSSAVNESPLDADAHFRLGATLGQLGDVAEAERELEIAIQLAPTWDRPRVEIGIIFMNHGRNDEAATRLAAARGEVDPPSTWLLYHLAVSHERVGDHGAAIAALDELLVIDPEHGEAHDRLAHLHLIGGDRRRGRRHAKQAAHLGFDVVFSALERGYYDTNGPKPRPPHAMPVAFVQSDDG